MRPPKLSVLCAFALAGVLAIPSVVGAQSVGFIAALVGTVEVRTGASRSWEAGLVDRDLEIGDIVRTEADSGAKILLVDESMLTLGASTELLIESYLVGSAALRDPSVLRLLKGRARVVIGEAFGGPTRVEMYTPTAVIGVKGSEYDVALVQDPVQGPSLRACSLEGNVWVRPIDPGGAGRPVDLAVGFCMDVFRGGKFTEPYPGSPSESGVAPELEGTPGSGSTETLIFGEPGVGAGSGSGPLGTPWLIVSPGNPAPASPIELAPGPVFVLSPGEAQQVPGAAKPEPVRQGGPLVFETRPR